MQIHDNHNSDIQTSKRASQRKRTVCSYCHLLPHHQHHHHHHNHHYHHHHHHWCMHNGQVGMTQLSSVFTMLDVLPFFILIISIIIVPACMMLHFDGIPSSCSIIQAVQIFGPDTLKNNTRTHSTLLSEL